MTAIEDMLIIINFTNYNIIILYTSCKCNIHPSLKFHTLLDVTMIRF